MAGLAVSDNVQVVPMGSPFTEPVWPSISVSVPVVPSEQLKATVKVEPAT